MSSKLESAIDELELWVWQTDERGRFIYSCTPSNNWLGYVNKEILSLSFSELIVVENSPSGQRLQHSIENRERLLSEVYVESSEGMRIPVMVCAKPQFDENEQFIGFKGVTSVINEENLEEFEENTVLHYLIDAIGTATVAVNPAGNIEYVNDGFVRLFGYTKEEIIGQPVSVMESDNEVSSTTTANSISILKDTGHLSLVRKRRKKNGEEITTLIRGKSISDQSGKISHFVGSYTDISELVDTKKKLELTTAENLRLKSHLQGVSADLAEYQRIGKIGSWQLNLETGDVQWTEELYLLFDMNPTEPPPNYSVHKTLFTEESFAQLEPAIQEASETGKIYELELEYISRAGRHGWMIARGEGIKNENGEVKELHGIVMDISHRKQMEGRLQEMYQELQSTLGQIVGVISRIVEYRDPYTAGHQRRVAAIATAIASKMKLSENFIRGVDIASQLHDIGKISIPAEILAKPGLLTDQEFKLIKEHSDNGYQLLKDIQFPWPVAEATRQHHERLDGSGYPDGLRNDDILLQARIIAVADVMESMITHRPYRPALGLEQALDEISTGAGSKYDADVAAACVSLFKDDNFTVPELR